MTTLYCLIEYDGKRYRYPRRFALPLGAKLIKDYINDKHEAALKRLWPIREVKVAEGKKVMG